MLFSKESVIIRIHPSNLALATNITKVGNNGAPAQDLRRHFQTKLKRVSLNQNELDPLEIITPERPYYTQQHSYPTKI